MTIGTPDLTLIYSHAKDHTNCQQGGMQADRTGGQQSYVEMGTHEHNGPLLSRPITLVHCRNKVTQLCNSPKDSANAITDEYIAPETRSDRLDSPNPNPEKFCLKYQHRHWSRGRFRCVVVSFPSTSPSSQGGHRNSLHDVASAVRKLSPERVKTVAGKQPPRWYLSNPNYSGYGKARGVL